MPRLFLLLLFFFCLNLPRVQADQARLENFFETKVRPLLAAHCMECHNDKKQQGDLRLDRRSYVFKGNESGPVVVPGKLAESRIWQVVQYDELDTQMPPKGKLSQEDLNTLKVWIEQGAYWPEDAKPEDDGGLTRKDDGSLDYITIKQQHWSYRPITLPEIPTGTKDLSNIDRLLLAKLQEKQLTFSEEASSQTLIRRASFDLLGVPPSYENVQQFSNNQSPEAWSQLVDSYLASPLYGQRWGRYWLDIARYADTKGYVFTQNRFYPYSYTYRDYVINSLNADVPYDQFLMEQVAADQLGYAENDPRLAALGFLTIGPRFLNRTPDIIDDRIDVVTRGLMGMTMACARCHDHKYDPIPTADYYSLYGVFNSCSEPDEPPLVGKIDENDPKYAAFFMELRKREQAKTDYIQKSHLELLDQAKMRATDYLLAVAVDLGKVPKDVKYTHGTPRDRTKEYWKKFSLQRVKEKDPVLTWLSELLNTPTEKLGEKVQALIAKKSPQQQEIAEALLKAELNSHEAVVRTFGALIETTAKQWSELKAKDANATEFGEAGRDSIRKLFDGPGSLTDLPVSENSPLFERDNRDKLRALTKKVGEWQASSDTAPPRSMVLFDKEKPSEPHIFIRGTVGRRGDRVPRRVPHLLDPNPESKFQKGSGRFELAQSLVDQNNPLTARVIVNRVWGYHFGTPLVSTPSDFGLRGERPSHPELLDYLAWTFIHEHGWSLKRLHREIMLTKAYRQSSIDRLDAREVDPANELYWKQNRKRLDFEAMRDAMLVASGTLDESLGGRPVDLEKQPFSTRRSVYGLIDRNNVSALLRTFDFPSPDSSSPGRPLTTVPQQALFAMNSPFIQQQAAAFAKRIQELNLTSEEEPAHAIRLTYGRDTTASEVELITNYLKKNSLEELAQALLMSNEYLFVD